jgi:hypothetical protein
VTIHANYGTKTPNRFGKGPLFSACYQQIFWEHPKIFNQINMKYFIYARKSTEEEDRQVLSIEAQLVELKEFAAKEKLEIVIGAAEPRFAGLAPRRRRLRNVFELFLEYSTNHHKKRCMQRFL